MFVIYGIYSFMLGAIFGSFFYCAFDRHVKKKSFVYGRSSCDTCGEKLGVPDLIPVFSALFNKGKCRHCGSYYGFKSTISEVLFGISFSTIYFCIFYRMDYQTISICVFIILLCVMSCFDIHSYNVPFFFQMSLVAVSIVYTYLAFGLVHALVYLVCGLLMRYALAELLSKWIGDADITVYIFMFTMMDLIYFEVFVILANVIQILIYLIKKKINHTTRKDTLIPAIPSFQISAVVILVLLTLNI